MLFALWYCMTMILIVLTYPFTPRQWRLRSLAACISAGLVFAAIKMGPDRLIRALPPPTVTSISEED
jgi:hypothetical protein